MYRILLCTALIPVPGISLVKQTARTPHEGMTRRNITGGYRR
jgi:hypothetical protein